MPLQETGLPASSTDPKTWTTFEHAAERADKFDGIGFVFGPERTFFGIDLDGCRDPETGRVAEWAREIILLFNSYAEVSPSYTGVKIFCRGRLPFDSGKKVAVAAERISADKEPAIEVYDHGRYFAVTGITLRGMPNDCIDGTEGMKHVANVYFKPTEKPVTAMTITNAGYERNSGLSVIDRARRYLDRIPPSISGQGGHNAAFHAACVLIHGFGLNTSEAMILMDEFNRRCDPPWSERDLVHKVESAQKQPGERNYLRNARQEQWDSIPLPTYHEPARQQSTFQVTKLEDAAAEYLVQLEAGNMDLISLGIDRLDGAMCGGVAFGEYIVIGARPSHGKTAFAMQLLDACCAAGYKSAIISEEMSKIALGKRAIQFAVDIPQEHWRYEACNVREILASHFASREPCYIIESVHTSDAAAEAIRMLVKEKEVRCVAVDYAQLLDAKGKSPYEKGTAASKALRSVVNDTGIVLFALVQLNREIEKRPKFVPKLSDIKECGQFEQDADAVLFLVWPHRIDGSKPPKEFQIWLAKMRNRGINENMVECEFTPSRLRIAEAGVNFVVTNADGEPIEDYAERAGLF